MCNIHEMIYTDNKHEIIKSYCIHFPYLGLTKHHLIGTITQTPTAQHKQMAIHI